MAGSDFPFSITSKFRVQGDAEHLVTIRAATAADMKRRLEEAAEVFPYAAFLSWLDCNDRDIEPDRRVPNPAPLPAPTPVAATEGQATADANARAAKARVRKAEGGGNGDQDERPCCPVHGMGLPSKFTNAPPGSLYCPQQFDDGSYCKWRWAPGKPAAVATS